MKLRTLILFVLSVSVSPYTSEVSGDDFRKITEGNIVEEEGNFRGGSWADYDGDGDLDLFVPRNTNNSTSYPGGNLIYRNDTNGGEASFTNINVGGGFDDGESWSKFGVWGDYNNDGLLDLFVTNDHDQKDFLYENDGAGGFIKITEGSPLVTNVEFTYAVAWGDCDQNGLLDLALEYRRRSHFVFLNRLDDPASDLFTGVPLSVGGGGHSAHWVDVDEDGDLDLYMTDTSGRNRLYLNDGDCALTEILDHPLVADSGTFLRADWGDYDGDGDLDLFVPDITGDNLLYQNHGKGNFTRVTEGIVVTDGGLSHQGAWGDYDNDGDLDLVVANGTSVTEVNNHLYENRGDGSFEKIVNGILVNDPAGSSGIAWGDYDGDGFLDVFVGNGTVHTTKIYKNFLYHNESIQNGNTNKWIKIECVGTVSNTSAFGTKVRVRAVLGGVERWQLRDIASRATSSLDAHFGLADASIVDEVRVEWPSGIVEIERDVKVNQSFEVTESDAPPQAHFTVTGEETGTVHVDAAGSETPDGTEILIWDWDFGDGETAAGDDADHTYSLPGRYVVTLTVLNNLDVGRTVREMITVPCPSGVVAPWVAADVGQPAFPGAARFEGGGQELHLCAGGREIGGGSDEFFFLYEELSGDFRITLKVAEHLSAASGALVGVMFRESLDEDARFGAMFIGTGEDQSRTFRFRRRTQTGGGVGGASGSPLEGAGWVRLERRGSELSGWSSLDGESWTLVRAQEIELTETTFGGVAAVANDPAGHTPTLVPLRVVITDLEVTPPVFLRGDCNGDGKFDISDGVFNLNFLFGNGPTTDCTEACNANDDAQNDVSDAVSISISLFGAAPSMAAPFPACGEDPEPESSLGCGRFGCE